MKKSAAKSSKIIAHANGVAIKAAPFGLKELMQMDKDCLLI